ncbi:hypothetical protein Afil01_53930 [Actinorhabdospora filicis]|uniref:Uncharacterized protein n=1 Tax=Actinorhabdospora filicis TaxID=1785913 RepID=A0A9W6WCH1_9ACTN|nr:hypothetical protein [Actinorhabdospora filicis]GLZ80586.1 hypothetical protein Afil01_53930 [Actinorhabdospora filicis]
MAAALTAALAACASPGADTGAGGPSSTPSAPATAQPPASSASPDDGSRVKPGYALQIIVTKTGGFAGLEQKVVIAEDGSWTFTDSRAGKTETGKLATAKLQQLQTLAKSDGLTAPPGKTGENGNCADMFMFGITVGDTVTSTDDCGRAPNQAFEDILALVVEETAL